MKKQISTFLSWFFGVILLLMGLVQFSDTYYVSAILLFAAALLVVPISRDYFFSKAGGKVSEYRVVISVCMVFIGLLSIAATAEQSDLKNNIDDSSVAVVEESDSMDEGLSEEIIASEGDYDVVNVVDGDTVDVLIDGVKVRIRLIGVDTPETVHPSKPVECFGEEASAFTKSTLLNKTVRLEADSSQGNLDKYDRLLRYIFLEDGTNFNEMLISEGYAFEYTYNLPYKYQEAFIEAEKQAESNERGLWAPGVCEPVEEEETTVTSQSDVEVVSALEDPQETPVIPVPVIAPEPEPEPEPVSTPTSSYSCGVSKNCGDMVSCDEAYYYLNTCGKTGLDRDKDGIPCESICN